MAVSRGDLARNTFRMDKKYEEGASLFLKKESAILHLERSRVIISYRNG